MVSNLVLLGGAIFFIWLLILSILTWNIISHYNKLTAGTTQRTLKSVLENLLKDINFTKKELDNLKNYCNTIQKEGLLHIQKVGLLRFNPFKDTGGDQSFILSLIDGKNTGVIISGLYSRSGTRWYAKRIVDGKSVDHDLSEEEKKALKEVSGS
ncbi:MAG TPA: DUF4446 family protein [Patescibacteria group bacterium]|nr:DUF4446 family protein [Patescibacteria group bacterium]